MKTKEEIYSEYSDNPIKWMQDNNCATTKEVTLKLMEAYHEDKTRWISAEKRLPEFGEPVFVWCRIYGRYIGTYQQIDGTRFGNWSDGKDLGVLPPLFWQPLPTPPKINAE